MNASRFALCALCALGAGPLDAAQDAVAQRYLAASAGIFGATSLDSTLVAVNHPTRCDTLLYPPGTAPAADPACTVTTPSRLFGNSFEPAGFVSGSFGIGYAFGPLRIEAEYSASAHGGESTPLQVAGGNAALVSKDAEWAVPPTESISNMTVRAVFANAYYDFKNDSPLTPYVGIGVGMAAARLDQGVSFVRKPEAAYLAIEFTPDWPEEAKRAAAGTISMVDSEVDDRATAYQVLLGVDYALSSKVSLGMRGTWTRLGELTQDITWETVRSHAPVQADGVTPFTSTVSFDGVEYTTIEVTLKYAF